MSVRYNRCPFDQLAGHVPQEGRVLDLGCGHGLFSNFMALQSGDRHVIGLDPSVRKIDVARRSVDGRPNIQFIAGRIEDLGSDLFSAVTLIDVLYLLTPQNQVALLKSIRQRLRKGGVLVVKEVPLTREWSFKVAFVKEIIQVQVLKRTMGESFSYRTRDEWVSLLNETGYSVKTMGLNTKAPSTLFVCSPR